jgi:4-hydroxythreonine-4-phosphate dehydrogenase
MDKLFGVTMGDSSGVGPEILLKAFGEGKVNVPIVAFGDLEALEYYNERLACGVSLRKIAMPREFSAGPLNVIDAGVMSRQDVSVGKLSAKSGHAAREYVVAAARAALAGEIAAMVTLPMNK